MLIFILILLFLAAAFGVLGTVLKVTFVLVISFVLAVVVLGVGGYYYVRHRYQRFQRESGTGAMPGSPQRPQAPSSTITVEVEQEERDPKELGPDR